MHILYGLIPADDGQDHGAVQLWMCARDGSDRTRLVGAATDPVGARWSPDGRSIAFVATEADGFSLQVYAIAASAAPHSIATHRRPISCIAWSPDSTAIAYNAGFDPSGISGIGDRGRVSDPGDIDGIGDQQPRVRVVLRRDYQSDGRGFIGDLRTQVFVADLAGGSPRLVTEPGQRDHGSPGWSPDGRYIATLAGTPHLGPVELLLIDVDRPSGAYQVDQVCLGSGFVPAWAWSPDGSQIAIVADPDGHDHPDIFVYDVRAHELRRVIDDPPCLVISGDESTVAGGLFWLDAERFVCHGVHHCASGLYVIDIRQAIIERSTQWQAQHGTFSVDIARRFAVSAFTSFDVVSAIAVHDLGQCTSETIVDFGRLLLADCPPVGWQRLEVAAAAGTVEVFTLLPPDFTPEREYPLVVDIHGGPQWYFGYQFWPWQQVLAAHGFIVAIPNVRGSASYGRRWSELVYGDWGPGPYDDLMRVVDTFSALPYIDPSRIGLHGYSYGGYLTNYAISQTDRFAAAVSGGSVFDLRSYWGSGDLSSGITMRRQLGGTPSDAGDLYRRNSPSEQIHRASTPTLIIHGEADLRCPVNQSDQLFAALSETGCETAMVRYPGADHDFVFAGAADQRADYCGRVLSWMQSHMGGR